MLTDLFWNGHLSESMRAAIITLILKKDKYAAECSSLRPNSLLPVNLKIISKLIAHRLENLMPQIIKPDQSDFVKTRYATDNIRRLLNVIGTSSLHNRTVVLQLQKRCLNGSSSNT